MNGKITSDITNIEQITNELKAFKADSSLEKVSTKETKIYKAENETARASLLDLGATDSFAESFATCGITVTSVAYNTKAEEIIASGTDGIIISQGPGNPNDYPEIIEQIKILISKTRFT